MGRVVPFWVAQAVPAALSNLRFHSSCDYTALTGVRDLFGSMGWRPTAETVNRGIENVLAHRRQPLDRQPYLVSPDDKGIIDFVKLAFLLFGYRAESFLPLYWVVLAASSLLFLFRFGAQPSAMILLIAFLLGHASALPIVVVNPQLVSVLALRFMSVLGVVATLHLVLETRADEPMGLARWAGMLGQTAILIFVLHVRFSAIWEVLCIGGASALAVIGAWRRKGMGKRLARAAVPALLAACGTIGLSEYKRAAISPTYYRDGDASHVFWHSVFSGLAFSPELGSRFDIRIDDASVFVATRRFLAEQGQQRRWEQMGGSGQRYDAAVRDMFFATCREWPAEVCATIIYHKPRAMALYVAWFLRLVPEPEYLDVLWPTARAEYQGMAAAMDREDKALRLFRPGCLALLLLTMLWAGRSPRGNAKETAGIALLLGLCGLMPSVLGYPVAHTIGDALVCFGMLVYVALMLGALAAWDWARKWAKPHAGNP